MHYLPRTLVRSALVAALLFTSAAIATAQQSPTPDAAQTVAPLTAADRARYVGVYETETPEGMLQIHIYEVGETLMGRPENEEEPSPLAPLGNHRFRPTMAEELVLVFTVENDKASQFTITFPDERGTVVALRKQ